MFCSVVFFAFSTLTLEAKELFYLQGKVNINNATKEELKVLPFVGSKRAESIISHRKKNGPFQNTRELLSIDGIGKDVYFAIQKYLAVSGKTDLHFSKFTGPTNPTILIDSFGGPLKVLENEKYFHALMEKIKGAEKSIKVCMYVFKASNKAGNLANQVLGELIAASKRGIKVELLLEKNDRPGDSLNRENTKTANRLKKAGITVRFDQEEINTHSKLVIIDEKWVFLGSHNLTHTALGKSNETSLLVESRDLAKTFLEYLRNIELNANLSKLHSE